MPVGQISRRPVSLSFRWKILRTNASKCWGCMRMASESWERRSFIRRCRVTARGIWSIFTIRKTKWTHLGIALSSSWTVSKWKRISISGEWGRVDLPRCSTSTKARGSSSMTTRCSICRPSSKMKSSMPRSLSSCLWSSLFTMSWRPSRRCFTHFVSVANLQNLTSWASFKVISKIWANSSKKSRSSLNSSSKLKNTQKKSTQKSWWKSKISSSNWA